MSNQNPFMPGDLVVCIESVVWDVGVGPAKDEVLTVCGVTDYLFLDFLEYNPDENTYLFSYFAPVQDATDMEFEEIEYAHYEEMTA